MAVIYADVIISGHFLFENVPESRKAEVEAELNRRGYGTDGQPL